MTASGTTARNTVPKGLRSKVERQRCSDCTRSRCKRWKLRTSLSFDAIITFRTSNARTSLYPLPETPIPLNPPSPLPNILQNSSRTAASTVLLFHTDQHNRVHRSEEVLRSFTIAPCVVVERLEGKQRCSRAPVDEHAGLQAREYPKLQSTRNEWSMKNNQTPQQPIRASRQRGGQTTSAHLHWCGADPLCSWPAQAAGHRGDLPKRGYNCAIFAGFLKN